MLSLLVICLVLSVSYGVTPTGEMLIRQYSDVIYVAPGSVGSDLSALSQSAYRKLVQPSGDLDGCAPVLPHINKNTLFYLLVARGNCSFEDKAEAAERVGAKGVVIYNSLEGIYQGNDYADSDDFECDNGEGWVDELTYPVYSDEMSDAMPTDCTNNPKCSSGRCLVTNETFANQTKVCCAWDLYLTMGSNSDDKDVQSNIPAVFIRLADYDTLTSFPELDKLSLDVVMYSRSTTAVLFSSCLIWMLACFTIYIGAFCAAEEDKMLHYSAKSYEDNDSDLESTSLAHSHSGSHRGPPIASLTARGAGAGARDTADQSYSTFPTSRTPNSSKHDITPESDDGTLDITPSHALLFIVMSSGFLTLLYYVDMYSVVSALYVVSAVMACSIVLFQPIFQRVVDKYVGMVEAAGASVDNLESLRTAAQAVGLMSGLSLGISWYMLRDSSWQWVIQDIMGMAVCIMFLRVIRLPNLKAATVLLSLAFLYDVFFVFISPYIFSSSVMVDVATGASSTSTHSDENYCEKYPTDDDCQSTALPMMLLMPTFSSYITSESILGLGDLVLPGLLLVWAARYDMRRFGQLSLEDSSNKGGYFSIVLFGYGFGLFLANLAVDYFETGQPALLYIVPCTLGPVLVRSFQSETLYSLWHKLPRMKIIAIPVQGDEREALLARSNVVEAMASWTDKDVLGGVNSFGVVVLDNKLGSVSLVDDFNYSTRSTSSDNFSSRSLPLSPSQAAAPSPHRHTSSSSSSADPDDANDAERGEATATTRRAAPIAMTSPLTPSSLLALTSPFTALSSSPNLDTPHDEEDQPLLSDSRETKE